MMKKFVLVSALFLVTFLIFPSKVHASCSSPNTTGGVHCTRGLFGCTDSNNNYWCCTVEDECTHVAAPSPGGASGGPSPTCNGGRGIDTAIGCIPIENTSEFIAFILRWAIGIGGGIAFLLIVYAAFMIMTSRGNPERLKAGQELLNSAIAGLILLIFSIFILRVIGIDILKLPGFGGT